jgi:hypothetical protein
MVSCIDERGPIGTFAVVALPINFSSVTIVCQSRESHIGRHSLQHHSELDKTIAAALDEHEAIVGGAPRLN